MEMSKITTQTGEEKGEHIMEIDSVTGIITFFQNAFELLNPQTTLNTYSREITFKK